MKKDEKSVDQMAEEAMKASTENIADQIEQTEEKNAQSEGQLNTEDTAQVTETSNVETPAQVAEPTDVQQASDTELPQNDRPDNSDALAVLDEENKWERKERKKEEKAKAKQAKKRAKYADVDDDTYYAMKASGFHKAFGVFSLLLMLAGIGLAAYSVYKLAIAPAYEDVVDSAGDLEVVTIATPGDSSLAEQRVQLSGLATSSDALIDTWVETPYEASATDAEYDNMDYEEETVSEETVEE